LTTSGSSSQDILTIVIAAATGGGLAFFLVLGILLAIAFFAKSWYKRVMMNRSLNSMPSAVSI